MREQVGGLPLHYRDPVWQLAENEGFLRTKLPHLFKGGFRVLEIGPGSGCSMLLMREWGNEVHGSDCICEGGMALAYSKITRALDLPVVYYGFDRYLRGDSLPVEWPASFDLIYLRRSVSSVLSDFGRALYSEATEALLDIWHRLLSPGGRVHVDHNSGEPQVQFQATVAQYMGPLVVESNTHLECRLRKL